MGRYSHRKLGWIVLTAVVLVASLAGAAALNERARLRDGPSKEAKLLGWVEQGTTVTLEGQRNGWYLVTTADGQTGYVWQEHLRFDAGEGAPSIVVATTTFPAATTPPATSPPSTMAPEARPGPGWERTETSVTAELERLRAEVARLATAQQELARHLDRTSTDTPPSSTVVGDGSAGAATAFLIAGGALGWLLGRFLPGRRDRRPKLRL